MAPRPLRKYENYTSPKEFSAYDIEGDTLVPIGTNQNYKGTIL
jgi:hypothetical protein